MTDIIKEASDSGWVQHHRDLYLADGEAAHIFDTRPGGGPGLVPTLLLYTTGRRSGKQSIMPLGYGVTGDGDYILIASKAGYHKNPGWYYNLLAEPNVRIKLKNETFNAVARVAEGVERQRCWDQMVEMYSPFNDYQKKTGGRQIPVIVVKRN